MRKRSKKLWTRELDLAACLVLATERQFWNKMDYHHQIVSLPTRCLVGWRSSRSANCGEERLGAMMANTGRHRTEMKPVELQ